ncbi:ABC transporter substrate-binding protein [Nonomuraea basaltis]|uniref:ABC transporter substrate-binding protein n=1 Tax=Nonomuraea basaltis TaxID=2495887 RepID=UPI00110C5B5C|nr:ABC transporter substrate-binding protein [Nonomuraea basaltis]TMR95924.1 ABC transporter substrate-binding protein [Nonomuraea basaltis]
MLKLSAGFLGLVLTLTACGGGTTTSLAEPSATASSSGAPGGETIVIGTANFTENVTLGYVYAGLLESKGYTVTVKPNLGSREIIFPALKNGEVDILPEYQGALMAHLDPDAKSSDGDGEAKALAATLPAELKVLPYAPAQDQTVWLVTKETAAKHNLKSMEDLAKVSKQLVYGAPPENKTRYVGVVGLKKVYGIEFKEFKSLDVGGPLTKAALKNGDVDVADGFSSDPAIADNGWIVLEDPEHLAPTENIAPLVSTGKVTDKLTAAFTELNAKLTTEELVKMNRRTDVDKEDPEDVADEWLKTVGLV